MLVLNENLITKVKNIAELVNLYCISLCYFHNTRFSSTEIKKIKTMYQEMRSFGPQVYL